MVYLWLFLFSARVAGRGLRGAAAVPRGQQGGLHGVGQRRGLRRVLLPGAHPEHQGQRRGGKGGRPSIILYNMGWSFVFMFYLLLTD